MEVHNHSHSHGKNNWKDYFWEFLMLFLAVFSGFMAEYQLEHIIERQRENQYALTLYEDVQADTIELKTRIKENLFTTSRIDSFRTLVHTHEINSFPSGTWYYYGRWGTKYFTMTFQNATLEQLKNSGGLRYFKKQNVINAIAHYDQSCRDLKLALDVQNLIYNELIKTRNKIFDAYYLDEVMSYDVPMEIVNSFKQKIIPLLSAKKEDFIQYSNVCQLRSHNNKGLLKNTQDVINNAVKLLNILKEEYKLK